MYLGDGGHLYFLTKRIKTTTIKMSDEFQPHHLHRLRDEENRNNPHAYPYLYESYGQWLALVVLLTSFAAVVSNTGNDAVLATLLAVCGLLLLIWSTPFYFMDRWGHVNNLMLLGLLFIVVWLALCCGWTIYHIQTHDSRMTTTDQTVTTTNCANKKSCINDNRGVGNASSV
jgi:hypothetical protein